MTKYTIDYSGWTDEGGYCQVYSIKNKPGWIFKEFRNKKKAHEAYSRQKVLSKYDLAPQVYSNVCQLDFAPDGGYNPATTSDWGYITEFAKVSNKIKMTDIQHLVENIYKSTGLKFWDCHYYNVGLVSRNKTSKLVCIDTGKESFDGLANAWGNLFPGPRCHLCYEYQCRCSTEPDFYYDIENI